MCLLTGIHGNPCAQKLMLWVLIQLLRPDTSAPMNFDHVLQFLHHNIQVGFTPNMFVSKTNAVYLNKPPKGKVIKPRVLPGWGDDDQDTEQRFRDDFAQQTKAENIINDPTDLGLLGASQEPNDNHKETPSRKIYYDWDELNEMTNIECEKKLVETMVEPGGVRIKPNESMFTEFLKESRGMDPTYLGSLLLSKVQVNYPFQVKAKALYTIEYLCRKNQVYSNYFKAQSEKLKEFPEPEDNVENYRKILKSVLNVIGVSLEAHAKKEENIFTFVDPGYNDHKEPVKDTRNDNHKKNSVPSSKKFISPADAKRGLKGPQDLISGSEPENHNDLLLIQQPKQCPNDTPSNFTFDDLLKESTYSQPNPSGLDFRL